MSSAANWFRRPRHRSLVTLTAPNLCFRGLRDNILLGLVPVLLSRVGHGVIVVVPRPPVAALLPHLDIVIQGRVVIAREDTYVARGDALCARSPERKPTFAPSAVMWRRVLCQSRQLWQCRLIRKRV